MLFQPKWAPEGPRGLQNWDETSPRGPQCCKTSILEPTSSFLEPLFWDTGHSVWEGFCVLSFAQRMPPVVVQGTPVRVCQLCAFLLQVRREWCMVLCESPCVHGGALALQLMIRVALFASLCETLQVLAFIRVMFILFLASHILWLAARSSFFTSHVALPCRDLLMLCSSFTPHSGTLGSLMSVRSTPFVVCSTTSCPETHSRTWSASVVCCFALHSLMGSACVLSHSFTGLRRRVV